MAEDRYKYYSTLSDVNAKSEEILKEVNSHKDYIVFKDQSDEKTYSVMMNNGLINAVQSIKSAELKSYPTKTEYYQHGRIDFTGLQIEATKHDGTKFIVDNKFCRTVPEKFDDTSITQVMIIYSDYGVEYSFPFDITVVEAPPSSFTVTSNIPGAYGFIAQGDGYYYSNNKGISSSYAMCEVNIYNPAGLEVIFDCINWAEKNYDYGMLSVVDETLNRDIYAYDTSRIYHSFKGKSYESIQSVSYGNITSGLITVKFVKDSGGNEYNDRFMFTVRFV